MITLIVRVLSTPLILSTMLITRALWGMRRWNYTLPAQILSKIIFYNLPPKSGEYSHAHGCAPFLIYCLLRGIKVNIPRLIIHSCFPIIYWFLVGISRTRWFLLIYSSISRSIFLMRDRSPYNWYWSHSLEENACWFSCSGSSPSYISSYLTSSPAFCLRFLLFSCRYLCIYLDSTKWSFSAHHCIHWEDPCEPGSTTERAIEQHDLYVLLHQISSAV